MDRSGLQRIIPIIIVIIIIVLAATALFSLGRTLFGGGDTPSPQSSNTPAASNGKESLKNTNADRSVRMLVRGPIVAGENFHSYMISVTPNSRTMTTYVGYLGQQVDNAQLGNDVKAYEQFVYALSRAKLMDGTPLTGDANNTAGICATGTLYMFDVMQGTNVVQSLWTSTCKGSPGSLKANLQQVSSLFQRQIPNYSTLASKISLR